MNYQKGYNTLLEGLINLYELVEGLERGEIVNILNCIEALREKSEQVCNGKE